MPSHSASLMPMSQRTRSLRENASVALCSFALLLCGCDHSKRDAADRARKAAEGERQAARQSFRQTLAAVKITTKGSTYDEFRRERLAVEACYEANKQHLSTLSGGFQRLDALLKACDYCWTWQIRFPEMSMRPVNGGEIGNSLEAMQTITPSISSKLDLSYQQREKDPDFYAKNYVRRALRLIDDQCEMMLAQVR